MHGWMFVKYYVKPIPTRSLGNCLCLVIEGDGTFVLISLPSRLHNVQLNSRVIYNDEGDHSKLD